MELNEWLVLVLLTFVAIFGLLFASGASGGVSSTIGMLVAIAAVVGIFVRIKQYFDRTEASHH